MRRGHRSRTRSVAVAKKADRTAYDVLYSTIAAEPNIRTSAYLVEEHSCQISSRSNLKRWSLGLFQKDRRDKKEQQKQDSVTVATRSVPDVKHNLLFRAALAVVSNSLGLYSMLRRLSV